MDQPDVGGVVLPVDATYSVTGVPLIPLPVAPVLPVRATANENFLLIVIPSTDTGIVASQAAFTVAVVVNLIVTFDVPLLDTAALMPVGHTIDLASTVTTEH